ncbi:iron-sulfur cluster assembly 2 homolog, mitochondrial-like [Styela clava]
MSTVTTVGRIFTRLMPSISHISSSHTVCRCLSQNAQTKPLNNADLILTESCVEHLKKFSKQGEFLRVSVEGGGCSGFSYKFDLDTTKEADDRTFTRDGVEVVTDSDSLDLIKGSKIDYQTEIIKSAFRVIDNPQSGTSCSCGVSFSVDL